MLSDKELTNQIVAALKREPSLDTAQIGVMVEDGVAVLTGYVRNYSEEWIAARTVGRVQGVRGVVDKLTIRLPEVSQRPDPEIERAAVAALHWNDLVPADKIQVTVKEGVVTLQGEVDWHYQRDAALKAIRHLTGVQRINNQLTLAPSVVPRDIEADIKQAFIRHAQLDAEQIYVERQGSKVILRGVVRSLAERKDAEEVAWATPGVADVESYLVVV